MQSLAKKTAGNAELLFPLGAVVMTQGVAALVDSGFTVWTLIARHARGDWGDVEDEDREENEFSVASGGRVFSAYQVHLGGRDHRIWVITEADRSVTTALLPEEY